MAPRVRAGAPSRGSLRRQAGRLPSLDRMRSRLGRIRALSDQRSRVLPVPALRRQPAPANRWPEVRRAPSGRRAGPAASAPTPDLVTAPGSRSARTGSRRSSVGHYPTATLRRFSASFASTSSTMSSTTSDRMPCCAAITAPGSPHARRSAHRRTPPGPPTTGSRGAWPRSHASRTAPRVRKERARRRHEDREGRPSPAAVDPGQSGRRARGRPCGRRVWGTQSLVPGPRPRRATPSEAARATAIRTQIFVDVCPGGQWPAVAAQSNVAPTGGHDVVPVSPRINSRRVEGFDLLDAVAVGDRRVSMRSGGRDRRR